MITYGPGTQPVAPHAPAQPAAHGTLQQAITAFGNRARTQRDRWSGAIVRTPEWEAFLRQRGLLGGIQNSHGPATGGKAPMPGGAKPNPGAGGPAGVDPGFGGPIDPRDGQYQAEVGQAAFDRDRGIADVDAQRQTLASQYNRGSADILTGFNRNRYDSNAELAHRGIVRSGEYQRRGADREMDRIRQQSQLENDFGSGAQARLAARLAEINQAYNLSSQGALSSAMDRYKQMYPASPLIAAGMGS